MPDNKFDHSILHPDFKLGILGGGQLGKMLLQAASTWNLQVHILDQSKKFPAGSVCQHFTEGDFKDYETVYQFGKNMDTISIEIETVNTKALHQLAAEGITVHPAPEILDIIRDKGLQKAFYKKHKMPSAPFELFENAARIKTAIEGKQLNFPFVQKARTEGYDGRGVAVIRSLKDIHKLLDIPSIIEPLVNIKMELAVIVAKNKSGQIECFPPVEMTFHPTANLVEFLIAPARIDSIIEKKAIELARKVIQTFDLCGLLAVEMFLTNNGHLLINEVAPRPHNSGHHTIDNSYTSQFEQHLRAVLNLPLGSTQSTSPAVMVNLLGMDGFTGIANYEGLEEIMAIEGAKIHLYGKQITKPFRKMGHATILENDLENAIQKARLLQETLKIKAL